MGSTHQGLSYNRLQCRQYHRCVDWSVLKEHTIIYGQIGDAFFLENLAFVGEYDCAVNAIFGCFQEFGKRAMFSIIFARLYFYRQYLQLLEIIDKEIYLT